MNTLELIQLWKNGDKAARDKVIEENVRLVWSIVRRFNSRGYDLEDLFQIGSIGLIKAVDKFDLDYGVQFSTYAVPIIVGEIKRFLRDDGLIKVSRGLKEISYKACQGKEKLMNMLGREPTIDEISEFIGVEREEVIMALDASMEVESIYKTVYQSEGNSIYLVDKIEENTDEHSKVVDKIALKNIIDELTDVEQEIIRLRYFEERTQTYVASKLNISQVQVSRLEKKILLKMRKKLQN